MIGTDISGNSVAGGNQLLDILSVVTADPAAYKKKIADLEALVQKNQQLIDLVAPAEDIISLRDKLRAELAEAKASTDAAKIEAAGIVAKANGDAADALRDGKAKAKKLTDAASATQVQVQAALAEANASTNAAKTAENAAQIAQKQMLAKAAESEEKAKLYEKATADLHRTKQDIIAKHKAFIESL